MEFQDEYSEFQAKYSASSKRSSKFQAEYISAVVPLMAASDPADLLKTSCLLLCDIYLSARDLQERTTPRRGWVFSRSCLPTPDQLTYATTHLTPFDRKIPRIYAPLLHRKSLCQLATAVDASVHFFMKSVRIV